MDSSAAEGQADNGPSGSPRRGRPVLRKIALIGPAVIIGALAFGPGSTVSAAAAGARNGYNILWLLAISVLLMLVYTDMAVRVGLAWQVSPLAGIRELLGRPVAIATGLAFYVVQLFFMTGAVVGTGLGLSLLLPFGTVQLWSLVSAAVALILLWFRHAFKALQNVMIGAVAVMIVVFAVTAVLSRPSWVDVGLGFVPGSVTGGGVVVFALLSTSLSMSAAFYTSYTIREKKTRRDQYKQTTLVDTLPGVVLPGIMTMLIVIAAGAVARGSDIQSAGDIARILTPTVGVAASFVFAVGIFAAGFSTIMGIMAAGGTILSDALQLGDTLESIRVKLLGSAVLVAATVVTVVFGSAPVQLVIVANSLTLFLFPFLGAAMFILVNSKSRMNGLVNSAWQNVLAVIALLLAVWGAVQVGIELGSGM